MREKLIELLEHDDCPLLYVLGEISNLADYLLSHGVIALPFGIDNYAYTIEDGEVYESRVHSFEVGRDCQGSLNIVYTDDGGFLFDLSDIGKTVFKSEDAAKAALKKEEEACQDPRS